MQVSGDDGRGPEYQMLRRTTLLLSVIAAALAVSMAGHVGRISAAQPAPTHDSVARPACGVPALDQPAPVAPAQATPAAVPDDGYVRYNDAAQGISYEVPAGWSKLSSRAAWSVLPAGNTVLDVGPARERDWSPAVLATAQPLELGWTAGTLYRVAVAYTCGITGDEYHAVLDQDGEHWLDVTVGVELGTDPAVLLAVQQHLLASIQR